MLAFETAPSPPVTFGAGSLAEIPSAATRIAPGVGHVLIVADEALARIGHVDRAAAFLREARIAVSRYSRIAGEPTTTLVDDLAERARSVHLVVALGGGATLDAARLAAATAGAHRPSLDYARGTMRYPPRSARVICLPTTAGAGAQVTSRAVVIGPSGERLFCRSPALRADAVILDPELTVSLPPSLTAWTGLDVVVNAIEAATAAAAAPLGLLFAVEALRLAARHLPAAVADGHDLAARGGMLWAATLAGMAVENSALHAVTAVGHALGAAAHLHHGLARAAACGAVLPWLAASADPAAVSACAAALDPAPGRPADLPGAFAALLGACRMAAALPEFPVLPAMLDAGELAASIRAPQNAPLLHAAPRRIGEAEVASFVARLAGRPSAAA